MVCSAADRAAALSSPTACPVLPLSNGECDITRDHQRRSPCKRSYSATSSLSPPCTDRLRACSARRLSIPRSPPSARPPACTAPAASLRLPRTTNTTRAPSDLHRGGWGDFLCPNPTRLPQACLVPAQPFTLAHAASLPSSMLSPSSPQQGPNDTEERRSASFSPRSRPTPPVAHRSLADSTSGLSATSSLSPNENVHPPAHFDVFLYLLVLPLSTFTSD
ncbi:hypothetical protein B0H16DRAFT_1752178 [Mycena metata]|uniref:Uncharacterized protein n=1 Tax=Mycena metata TaxID=1033252 RepID=A0AAD7GJC9_9AGAR|nr:hypothetical protein B0H16DRAFT_1752178 [Mycena metata]